MHLFTFSVHFNNNKTFSKFLEFYIQSKSTDNSKNNSLNLF